MNAMKWTAAVLVLAAAAGSARAEVKTVVYSAEVATVSNHPFGLSVPLNTVVTGYFTFDTDTPDGDADPLSGEYQHDGNAGFLARFLLHTVTGSETPFYEVDLDQNPDLDTFRIIDGLRPVGNEGGVMAIDDTSDADIELFVALTEDVFDDDDLIDPFPFYDFGFLGTPHTFSLKDDEGTMLLQITETSEAVCGDPNGVGGVTASDALFVLRAAVGGLACFPCICDADASGTTTATDALKVLRYAVNPAGSLTCSLCA